MQASTPSGDCEIDRKDTAVESNSHNFSEPGPEDSPLPYVVTFDAENANFQLFHRHG
jgi:hypothetical protein